MWLLGSSKSLDILLLILVKEDCMYKIRFGKIQADAYVYVV